MQRGRTKLQLEGRTSRGRRQLARMPDPLLHFLRQLLQLRRICPAQARPFLLALPLGTNIIPKSTNEGSHRPGLSCTSRTQQEQTQRIFATLRARTTTNNVVSKALPRIQLLPGNLICAITNRPPIPLLPQLFQSCKLPPMHRGLLLPRVILRVEDNAERLP